MGHKFTVSVTMVITLCLVLSKSCTNRVFFVFSCADNYFLKKNSLLKPQIWSRHLLYFSYFGGHFLLL